jgi:hypothetical protein
MLPFKRVLMLLLSWVVADSCIERVNFDIPDSYASDLVVDGQITNDPGPYVVKLKNVINVDATSPLGIPVDAKRITIYDDLGTSEVLSYVKPGTYQTDPVGIRGEIGRTYHIRVEMNDGDVFESIPDKMDPVGAVDTIYYDLETYEPIDGPTNYAYRIYIDAHQAEEGNNYIRWKFNGTYVVETLPQYTHCTSPPCSWCPTPCSGHALVNGELKEGYAINPGTNQPEYVIGLKCTCCRCWVSPPEAKPRVNDLQLSNGRFLNVDVGTIPVNFYTFFEKYRIQVVQMSLSRNAFDYWKAIESQKDAVGSLFQPVTGEIPTNVNNSQTDRGVQGIFYASAVAKKTIYLTKEMINVSVRVPQDYCNGILRDGAIGLDCRNAFPGSHSTTEKPADWID